MTLPVARYRQWRRSVSAAVASVFESLPLACIILNVEGDIIRVNVAGEEWFGQSRKRLLGKKWTELVTSDMLWLQIRKAAVEGGQAYLPHHTVTLEGELFVMNLRITPLDDPEFPEAVMILADKVERSREWAEDDYKHEIIRSAGVMAAMLAHEVNNPLSGIRGAAQLLQEEVSEENRELAALICKEVDRVRGVLDRVELFADHASLPVQPVNVHEVLRHAKQVAEHGFGRDVTFVEDFDPSLPEVSAHRDSLIHILLNLVKNACEAMQEIENPVITLKTHALSGVYLKPREAGGKPSPCVAVDILDNGPGINEAMKQHLFKPFVTSQGEGRGLGLAICTKLAIDIGGRLEVLDAKDGGACFRVMLDTV